MSSVFSSLGNTLIFAHTYGKLYSIPEFQDFNNNVGDSSPQEVVRRYFRNTMCMKHDATVQRLITTPEYANIFMNNNLSKQEQAKLFLAKLINTLYTTDKVNLMEGIPFTSFVTEKREFIKVIIDSLNKVTPDTWTKVKNGKDVYTLFVDMYAKNCTGTIFNLLNTSSVLSEDFLLQFASTAMGKFNDVYENVSRITNKELFDDYDEEGEECEEGDEADEGDGEKDEGDDCEDCESDEDEPTKMPPCYFPGPMSRPTQPSTRPSQPPPKPTPPKPAPNKNDISKRTYDQMTDRPIFTNPNKRFKY